MSYVSSAVQHPMFFEYPGTGTEAEPGRIIEVFRRRDASWVDPVLESLEQLAQLADNWDGRGSRHLNYDDVVDALKYLQRVMRDDTRPPSIGPLSSGGVELSWRVDGLEVEAIFDRLRDEKMLLVTAGSNDTEEPIDSSEMLFGGIVDRLTYY
jgi:hypothetical protein